MDDSKLPPLPKSDPESLQTGVYDPFYKVTPRGFWKDNEIIRQKVEPFQECEHFFESEENGVRCKKCHMGLGTLNFPLAIKEGQLFFFF